MYSQIESSANLIVVPDRAGCQAKLELFEQGELGIDDLVDSRLVCSDSEFDLDLELDLVSALRVRALL